MTKTNFLNQTPVKICPYYIFSSEIILLSFWENNQNVIYLPLEKLFEQEKNTGEKLKDKMCSNKGHHI